MGPSSGVLARLSANAFNNCQKLLPAAARATDVLLQKQQYNTITSSSTAHTCSSSSSWAQTAASFSAAASSHAAAPLLASSKGPWAVCAHIQLGSSSSTTASVRGFASFSMPSAHAGCGHSHHHDEPCADEITAQIRAAADLQQLQQLVQDASSSMTAGQAAAAFRRGAVLADKSPPSADALLSHLAPVWPRVVGQAGGQELSDVLLAWTKLRLQDGGLWEATLAAVPAHIKLASGQDLANIAYALAAMSDINGGIPGVPRPEVEALMRDITMEVVELVQGKGAGGGGAGERSVSVSNLATMRWSNEVFEESGAAESGAVESKTSVPA